MPWKASRITAREEAWFIERARSTPWDLVAPDALLRDADAAQPDELTADPRYRRAENPKLKPESVILFEY